MYTRCYKDFTDLFLSINKSILVDSDAPKLSYTGKSLQLSTMYLRAESSNMEVGLDQLHYVTKNKLNKLIREYIDVDRYNTLAQDLKASKAFTFTFPFNRDKPKQGNSSGNGPCLCAIVFTRSQRKEWEEATVLYRTTEINRRFAADLTLFNMLFKELDLGLTAFNLFIPQAYYAFNLTPFILPLVDVNLEDIGDPVLKEKLKRAIFLLSNSELSNFKMNRRVQRVLKGEPVGKALDISNLKISDFIKE